MLASRSPSSHVGDRGTIGLNRAMLAAMAITVAMTLWLVGARAADVVLTNGLVSFSIAPERGGTVLAAERLLAPDDNMAGRWFEDALLSPDGRRRTLNNVAMQRLDRAAAAAVSSAIPDDRIAGSQATDDDQWLVLEARLPVIPAPTAEALAQAFNGAPWSLGSDPAMATALVQPAATGDGFFRLRKVFHLAAGESRLRVWYVVDWLGDGTPPPVFLLASGAPATNPDGLTLYSPGRFGVSTQAVTSGRGETGVTDSGQAWCAWLSRAASRQQPAARHGVAMWFDPALASCQRRLTDGTVETVGTQMLAPSEPASPTGVAPVDPSKRLASWCWSAELQLIAGLPNVACVEAGLAAASDAPDTLAVTRDFAAAAAAPPPPDAGSSPLLQPGAANMAAADLAAGEVAAPGERLLDMSMSLEEPDRAPRVKEAKPPTPPPAALALQPRALTLTVVASQRWRGSVAATADRQGTPLGKLVGLTIDDATPAVPASTDTPATPSTTATASRDVALEPLQPASLRLTLHPPATGTYRIRVAWTPASQTAPPRDLQLGVVADQPSGWFEYAPIPRRDPVFRAWRSHGSARPPFPIDADWQPDLSVPGDHLTVADSLAGGPIRALFIVPYWQVPEVTALCRRLPVTADVLTIGRAGYRNRFELYGTTREHAEPDEAERARRLLNQPHDVVVAINLFHDWFPQDIMAELHRQAASGGTGLLVLGDLPLVGPLGDWQRDATASPEAFAAPAGVRRLRTATARIAFVDAAMPVTTTPTWNTEWDYEGLCRLLFWTAGRDQRLVSDDTVGPSKPLRVAQSALPGVTSVHLQPIATTLASPATPPVFPLTLHVRISLYRDLAADYPFYATVPLVIRQSASFELAADLPAIELTFPKAGQGATLPLALPMLPPGTYRLAMQATTPAGQGAAATESWLHLPLIVDGTADLLNLTLSSGDHNREPALSAGAAPNRPGSLVDTDADWTCTTTWRAASDPAPRRARLEGLDPWGRVAFRAEAPIVDNRAVLTIDPVAVRHRLLVLRAQEWRGDALLAESRHLIAVRQRPEQRVAFELRGYADVLVNPADHAYDVRIGGGDPLTLAWGANVSRAAYGSWLPPAASISTPSGTGTVVDPKAAAGLVPQAELADEPTFDPVEPDDLRATFTPPNPNAHADTAWTRNPCLSDPAWRDAMLASVTNTYRAESVFGPFSGFAVDEWFYYKEPLGDGFLREFRPGRHTNICRSPWCLARFREWSRARFAGDLQRLNTTWHTTFADWQEVAPPLLSTNANQPPHPSQWPYILAHRDFVDLEVADLLGDIQTHIEAIDPACRTGLSGVWKTGLWNGLDVYRLAQHGRYNMLYSQLEQWQSFGTGSTVQWGGYGAKYSPTREAAVPWSMLFRGDDAYGYYGKSITPMFQADGRYHAGPAALFDTMRAMHGGGFDRLLVGHRTRDPVTLYYSPRDIYLAGLEEWQDDPAQFIADWRNAGRSHLEAPQASADTLARWLGDRDVQFGWTAYAQLEAGKFGPTGPPRVLFLPGAECLSDRQAAVLTQYVHDGGVLVADLRPGWRDADGNPRAAGALDEVFGVRRPLPPASDTTTANELPPLLAKSRNKARAATIVHFGATFGEPFSLAFPLVETAPLELTTGKALAHYGTPESPADERPAVIANTFGKGRAILLNFAPTRFSVVEEAGVEGEESTSKWANASARTLLDRVLSTVMPPADLALPAHVDGGIKLTRFSDGDALYLGMTVSSRNPAEWLRAYHLTLAHRAHLYDLLSGTYLGEDDHLDLRFQPLLGRGVRLIAALPTRIAPPTLVASQPALPSPASASALMTSPRLAVVAGTAARLTVRAAGAENLARQIYGVRVRRPDGLDDPASAATWTVNREDTPTGEVTVVIPLPLNAQVGVWRVEITHASTGQRLVVSLDVTPAPAP